jgi:hypothetical protein
MKTMMHERNGSAEVTQIAVAAVSSWLTMMSLAIIGALAGEAYRGHHPLSDFAIIFVPIMTVPFVFVIAAVYLPTVLIARRMAPHSRRWMLAAVGGAAAPLAGLALLAAGRVLFSGSRHTRPALWDDIVALSRDPVHTLPYALALVVAGIVLGAMIGGVGNLPLSAAGRCGRSTDGAADGSPVRTGP